MPCIHLSEIVSVVSQEPNLYTLANAILPSAGSPLFCNTDISCIQSALKGPWISLWPHLTAEVWKSTTLVRERGIIHDVPVEHIELTVGHGILKKHRSFCIRMVVEYHKNKTKKVTCFSPLRLLPGCLKWPSMARSGVKCPTKSLWIESVESPLSPSCSQNTKINNMGGGGGRRSISWWQKRGNKSN